MRQVVGHLEVVVHEGAVLLGVQHFQQRGRRVAPEIAGHLVDLVEEKDRVAGLRLAHRLDDLARQGPDVGLAMAAYLRFVAHPAEGDPHELAVEAAGDGPAQRGLACARRADKAEDRSLDDVLELVDCDKVQDPLLDSLQPVVVAVESLARLLDVPAVFGELFPRQVADPLEVGPENRGLG